MFIKAYIKNQSKAEDDLGGIKAALKARFSDTHFSQFTGSLIRPNNFSVLTLMPFEESSKVKD